MAVFTLSNLQQMQDILNSGDRAGAYLYYYNLIKDVNRLAADQILIQMQITTYSGFFGGAALLGNSLAKFSNPDLYTMSLDEFSRDIVQGLIEAIRADITAAGDGILSQSEIQDSDRGVWDGHRMADYFPGKFQVFHEGAETLLAHEKIVEPEVAGEDYLQVRSREVLPERRENRPALVKEGVHVVDGEDKGVHANERAGLPDVVVERPLEPAGAASVVEAAIEHVVGVRPVLTVERAVPYAVEEGEASASSRRALLKPSYAPLLADSLRLYTWSTATLIFSMTTTFCFVSMRVGSTIPRL